MHAKSPVTRENILLIFTSPISSDWKNFSAGTVPIGKKCDLRESSCSFRATGACGARSISGGVAERLIAPVLKTGRPKGLVSSNLTPSASNFRFSIADLRFVAKENAPLEARRAFRELRRTQHRTNSARRYTSATVRSRLELGYRRDQFASLRKTKRQKRRRMLQHDRTGTSDIWC